MSHSTNTTNYKLSQFAGTDKPAWLEDYNADMLAIDTNLKSVSDTASGASRAIPSIQGDLDNVEVTANSAESKSSAALSNIAEAYDATSTYSIDDKVLYNNLMYKCITPISTAESFDGTKWKRVTIDEIITDLNDNLSATNNIAVTVKSVTDHVKHVIFNANLVGGSATQIAINTVLPAESTPMSIYTAIQGVSQNDGNIHNFYIQKSDNTLRYAETVPAGIYYFDTIIYSS